MQRYVRGYRALLDRPEARVALVAHGAPIRYILLAADSRSPGPVLEGVDPARPFSIDAAQLEDAVAALERWLASPAW